MRKFFAKRGAPARKIRRRRRKLKSACLALGLVTAWGGEAAADATFKVEITPQQTLTNALIFYGNNISSGVLRSLGMIPGGQTSTFYQTIVTNQVPFEENWTWEPSSYTPFQNKPSFYAMIGVYQGGSGPGVAVSFPNDDPIVNMATWSSIFQTASVPSDYRYEESDIIDDLINASISPTYPPHVLANRIYGMMEQYGEPQAFLGGPLATDYGATAVLVNFSDAAFGGTAIAQLVPEPASLILLVGALGIAFLDTRRRGGN